MARKRCKCSYATFHDRWCLFSYHAGEWWYAIRHGACMMVSTYGKPQAMYFVHCFLDVIWFVGLFDAKLGYAWGDWGCQVVSTW